ncbi:MAG: PspC domain-containing protein [Actinobacteria bacterium]|nr:PspC domain-containing protein [Actinomycetota bacterium]
MTERLYRSESDRMLAGVAGGMAQYFDMDPVLMRLIWVLAAIFSGGLFLIVYVAMAIITPAYSSLYGPQAAPPAGPPPSTGPAPAPSAAPPLDQPPGRSAWTGHSAPSRPYAAGPGRGGFSAAVFAGVTLLVIGAIAFLANFNVFGFYNPWRLWPVILIGIGLAIVFGRRAR